MKKLFIFFTLFIFACTSGPSQHGGELEERSGRWMKGSEWSTFCIPISGRCTMDPHFRCIRMVSKRRRRNN